MMLLGVSIVGTFMGVRLILRRREEEHAAIQRIYDYNGSSSSGHDVMVVRRLVDRGLVRKETVGGRLHLTLNGARVRAGLPTVADTSDTKGGT